jgi:endonuclease/exonuclease/phosphatase family metal-dependent hydrolase
MLNKTHITVATYNIQFAINTEKILDNLEQMTKDGVTFFCLQEIINIPQEIFIIEKILKRLGSKWKSSYHAGEEFSKVSIGTAIIWNSEIFKLKQEEKILLPKINKFDIHEKLFYKIINVEPTILQRKALSCYFMINHTEIRVTCIHLDNIGGPRHRIKQISYLISKLKEMKTPKYEIICGDLNTFDLLKTRYEKKLLQRKFGNKFVDASRYVDWTSDIHMTDFSKSNKLIPWFIKTFKIHIRRRLDYVWVKNMNILTCQKLELSGSDHFPIIAKLELE